MIFRCAIISCILFWSCNTDEGLNEAISVREFQHVVEDYDSAVDEYKYSYYKKSLDSFEVHELSKILERKGLTYFISNDSKLYIKPIQVPTIGVALVIDRELTDSIISKELPKSEFVNELIKSMKVKVDRSSLN